MQTVALARSAGKGEAVGNPLLREALQYAARGWQVLPLHTPTPEGCTCRNPDCKSAGKHPRTISGLKDASEDAGIIQGWWERWPEANVGIATGPDSRLCVLDVDGEDGQASLAALESLPQTLRALTGRTGNHGERKGFHLYFTFPNGATISNSAGRLGKGLDIRGSGGYVVAPPSIHSSGLHYEWDTDGSTIADLPAWLIAKLSKPALAIVSTPRNGILEGQRNSTLLSLAGSMHKRGMTSESIAAALQEENRQSCSPPLSEDEVSGIVASVQRYPQGSTTHKTRHADVRCLADVKPLEVEWLWEPYVPLKMITVVSGDPGAGKTFLALALAASLTRGERIVTGARVAPCNVLYLSNENSPEHVTRPRFDALEGDVSRFFLLDGTKAEDGTAGRITLADLEQLEEAIVKHETRLVIIDPLQSFLGSDVDSHRANQTRPIFDGLIRLSEKTGCAMLITRHLSKGLGGSALYRGMGSIDITGAARSELLVAKEPDQAGRIVMAQSKNSLTEIGPSLTYSITDNKLSWHGESSFMANDLLTAPPSADERSALSDAEDFLRETLAGGPRPVKEVQAMAEQSGISRATLRRAGNRLDAERKPGGFGKGWMLSLPTVVQESSELLISAP